MKRVKQRKRIYCRPARFCNFEFARPANLQVHQYRRSSARRTRDVGLDERRRSAGVPCSRQVHQRLSIRTRQAVASAGEDRSVGSALGQRSPGKRRAVRCTQTDQ